MLSKYLILFLVVSILFSCKPEDSSDCDGAFVSAHESLEQSYEQLFLNYSAVKAQSFKEELTDFDSRFKNVECNHNGEDLAPQSDVDSMLSQLNKGLASKSSSLRLKVVYGDDNRVDVVDSPVAEYRSWAASTMAQIPVESIGENGKLQSLTLDEDINLCSGERFGDQLTAAFCSGFLIAPDIIITAGHCIRDASDCSGNVWALDYIAGVDSLEEQQIYECKEVIQSAEEFTTGLDYAVVRLNKKVSSRKFFRWRNSGKISTGTPLVVIGHPSGLPAKIADGAEVKGNSDEHYFKSNLDTFGGSSGSVVVNATNGIAEGILVRGSQDYAFDPSPGNECFRVNTCSNQSGCNGEFEEVTRMSSVIGIPFEYEESKIFDDIFTTKSADEISTELPFEMRGSQYGDHYLAGSSFLRKCGIKFKNVSSGSLLENTVESCRVPSRINQAISNFVDMFYF